MSMKYATARYGKMRETAEVKTRDDDYRVFDKIVIKTDRGRELAELLTTPVDLPEKYNARNLFEILRRSTPDDQVQGKEQQATASSTVAKFTREKITELELPMKLIDVEHIWGGEKMVFYFVSEDRVDFRELVKELAQEFRTRIEMRQIGARDEAKLCGDCGHCGLTLCCRNHLKELGGITMEMAKLQKQTVDPAKVCGLCGKLLCCLKYEYRMYTEAKKIFPARGSMVQTASGPARVLSHNILLEDVIVFTERGERLKLKLAELKDVQEREKRRSEDPAPVQAAAETSGEKEDDAQGRGESRKKRGGRRRRRGGRKNKKKSAE
jgi:cell fate regulator YaaT (PSP1 superfamily)